MTFRGTGREIPASQVRLILVVGEQFERFFSLDTMPTIKHTLALHEVTKMHTSVVSVGITSGIGRTISGMTHKNSSKYQVKTTIKKAGGGSSL